ncbi:rhamnulokinase [Actinopolymorpha singaporensis]|uniref:Rhamnulokinase n=1 Tax=Actinopolymorpha singaporensis TaxID=117157 RepID=A0A1H1LEJ8_9ACTN|nr:rhamnulokinase family protein [Actinopolymorpha singaporensis]SDR72475.1 rhamnulokinase [Actinopolymorpha singaporensis]
MSDDVRLRAAAVDLGASSGRVLVGTVGPDHLDTEVVHRFPNEPVDVNGRLSWNLPSLWRGILAGIREAGERGVTSVGIDSWGVDYGLLDEAERLLAPPVHYRDSRTDGIMERVRADVGDRTLYATTGVQFMGFNTAYQLLAEDPATLRKARTMLLMPDLICHRLTGRIGAERTNASTTQLYDVRGRTWSEDLVRRLGLPRRLLPPLREPGDLLGPIRSQLRGPLGVSRDVWVTTVASHDTASAVAAVPAHDGHFAYVSCGTWSLVGMELGSPVLSAAGLAANFTNEVGVDGTIRYLRNVMGLWLLQESMRTWRDEGRPVGLARLLADAEAEPPLRSVVDAESPDFLAPGDMPERIRAHCRDTGQPEPTTPAQVTRCVLDSLALAHARNVAAAQRLSGRRVDVVHVVGGGAQNSLLCQLTADACGLPVVAGPVEATALGNLLVQARAHGVLVDRAEARDVVRRTQDLRTYEPRDHERWSALLAA